MEQQPNIEELQKIIEQQKPSPEQLQKVIFSLQTQVSEYIGKYTDKDVQLMEAREEIEGLKKELEEYRNQEIEEMDNAK